MVFIWEIIPFYGPTIQVSEILFHLPRLNHDENPQADLVPAFSNEFPLLREVQSTMATLPMSPAPSQCSLASGRRIWLPDLLLWPSMILIICKINIWVFGIIWIHSMYIYICIPVEPHKAVAEVSKIGNL